MSSIKEFEHLRIPLQAIKLATNNFDGNNYISRGGFGKVYKGELVHFGKSVMVAVKCLNREFGQGNPEFWKEIMMLSRYKHENLVSLLGFCYEEGDSIIVYEYLPNKSLNMHLSSIDLSWIQRLKICIGAAKGLQYLHDPGRTMQRVLHRDIKSSNILLDENWNAKISDFGLSNFGPANQEFSFLFTHPVGSFGYCDPTYVESGFLTKESDVYSFGVVLFEVLCGRLCIVDYDDNRRFLSKLAQSCYEENRLETIVQDGLLEQMSKECLRKFSTIAYQCLNKDRTQRPTFAKIVTELEVVLRFQYPDQSTFPKNDHFALGAYRSAADAAAHIPAAFRQQQSLKLQKENVYSSTIKVREVKLEDRITALHQLVSPSEKTDAVLLEAITHIKFLHDQVNFLSRPYMKHEGTIQRQKIHDHKASETTEGAKQHGLRNRGLCLVPVSSTFPVTTTETVLDYW